MRNNVPRMIWIDSCAIIPLDHFENGYFVVTQDGAMSDFRFYNKDRKLIHSESHDWWITLKDEDRPAMRAGISMLSFMSACAEAYGPESDNYSLFPSHVRDWFMETDLSILQFELEEFLKENKS